MPPAETAIHVADTDFSQPTGKKLPGAMLYPICDELKTEIALLYGKNLQSTNIQPAPSGNSTTISLSGGCPIGL